MPTAGAPTTPARIDAGARTDEPNSSVDTELPPGWVRGDWERRFLDSRVAQVFCGALGI